MKSQSIAPDSRLIQAVDRAIQLFKAVGSSPRPLAAHELAAECHLNRSTAWRLLATLEHHGLVERDPATQKYEVGYTTVRLAAAARTHEALIRRARPVLERLGEESGETVSLSISHGREATVPIYHARPPDALVSVNWIGRALPLHCTSGGKILLAHLPEAELQEYLGLPLQRYTSHTITDPDTLVRELERIRETDIAVALEEYEIGLHGVSAPILNGRGQPVAFVSIAGPSYRLTIQRIAELSEVLLIAVRKIGAALEE